MFDTLSKMNAGRVVIRAEVAFKLRGIDFRFANHEITSGNISGLVLGEFDPTQYIGEPVIVGVKFGVSKDEFITLNGVLASVITAESRYAEIRFDSGQPHLSHLAAVIQAHGSSPNKYSRRFPRIPESIASPHMPVHAIAELDERIVVFNIGNISPGGILVYSESSKADFVYPGTQLRMQIEPRGLNIEEVEFMATVCRMVLSKNPQNGNIIRSIGLKFDSFSAGDKEAFINVLRSIITDLTKA